MLVVGISRKNRELACGCIPEIFQSHRKGTKTRILRFSPFLSRVCAYPFRFRPGQTPHLPPPSIPYQGHAPVDLQNRGGRIYIIMLEFKIGNGFTIIIIWFHYLRSIMMFLLFFLIQISPVTIVIRSLQTDQYGH